MLIANFMRFRRKRLKKQTHIDNFSLKKKSKMNLFGFFIPLDVYTIKEVSKNKKNRK